jgi:hypothetical protein
MLTCAWALLIVFWDIVRTICLHYGKEQDS